MKPVRWGLVVMGLGCGPGVPKLPGSSMYGEGAAHSDGGGVDTADSGESDTAPPDPPGISAWPGSSPKGVLSPDPWRDPDWYRESGPMDEIFDWDSDLVRSYHWELSVVFQNEEGEWDSRARRVAHSFSSLDLYNHEDVGLIIAGGPFLTEMPVDSTFDYIFAITTPDLEHFSGRAFYVSGIDYDGNIDPSLYVEKDGRVTFTYFSPGDDVDPTINPENLPGPHDIFRARRDGTSNDFVEEDTPIASSEWLVDPVLCIWDNQRHLFATADGAVVHLWQGPDSRFNLNYSMRWGGAQVPFCYERDGRYYVVAQAGGGRGEPVVREFLGRDTEFSDAEPFFGGADPFGGACTAPVVGQLRGQWAMFCSTWHDPRP